jgi:hypothetical protein
MIQGGVYGTGFTLNIRNGFRIITINGARRFRGDDHKSYLVQNAYHIRQIDTRESIF